MGTQNSTSSKPLIAGGGPKSIELCAKCDIMRKHHHNSNHEFEDSGVFKYAN